MTTDNVREKIVACIRDAADRGFAAGEARDIYFSFGDIIAKADAILAALEATAPCPEGLSLDHLLASALYDSENTVRLQEHPEELDHYLSKARALRHHMNVLGVDVALSQPSQDGWRFDMENAGRAEAGPGVPLYDTWAEIGKDSRLQHARRVLSLHEIHLIVGHARGRPLPPPPAKEGR